MSRLVVSSRSIGLSIVALTLHRVSAARRWLAPLALSVSPLAVVPAFAQTDVTGVWEPVNYNQDIELTDVFFVTPEIGYVGGAGGTILKTTDSGATWTALLGGDPLSEEREIRQLWFIDETTGWATQVTSSQANLFRTTDGDLWEAIGVIDEHYDDFAFTSETDGIYVDDALIYRTQDAGKTWSEVYRCAASAQIGGLARQLTCNFWKMRYASPSVIYALGAAIEVNAAVIVKSVDGGASWAVVSVVENQNGTEGGLFFVDENTGYFSSKDSQSSFRTTDGGQTWTGMPATAVHRRIVFADPEVGWAMRYNGLSFTTDGGRRWSSRTIEFPAFPNAFSLPRRDVAYAVGPHGMIYRYSIVPAGTPTVANSIAAVAMPPLANGVIENVGELELGLAAIEAALAAPVAPPADAGAATDPALADAGWVEANYTEFGAFETTFDSVATGLPAIGSKHRNLNLLLEGLKLLGDLTGQGSGLKDAFASLRQARDPASVSAALLGMHAQLEAAKTSLTAFETAPASPP